MIIGQIDLDNDLNDFISNDEYWYEIKHFPCNKRNELYLYSKSAKEIYIIVSGTVWLHGSEYGAGTMLTYNKGERRDFFVITDTTCISLRPKTTLIDEKLVEGEITLDDFIAPYLFEHSTNRYNNIRNEEITVVIQGAIDERFTAFSIESVRRFLPGAYIVISTWQGASVDNLDFDDVVFNKDPGAPYFLKDNSVRHYDNRNRLLVSTQGGIKRVTTKYTLKMRSDCVLAGDGIVRNYNKYPFSSNILKIFKNKLVVGEQCNVMKLLFNDCSRPYAFHVSDWFCFGLTSDVRLYFDGTEIESEEQMTRWKYKREMNIPPDDVMGQNFSPRYNSEQYYFLSALRRKYVIPYEDASDYTDEIDKLSPIAIVNNFEILNIREHEIINAKKQYKQAWNLEESKNAVFFTNKKYESVYRMIKEMTE